MNKKHRTPHVGVDQPLARVAGLSLEGTICLVQGGIVGPRTGSYMVEPLADDDTHQIHKQQKLRVVAQACKSLQSG
jgi:hypothetical protein